MAWSSLDSAPATARRVGRFDRPSKRFLPVREKPQTSPSTPLGLIAMAQWFGLATGLCELVCLLVRNYFNGSATMGELQLNRHFTWMIPSANWVIFSALGLAVAPLGFLRSRWTLRAAAFGFLSLSCFSLLDTVPGLYTFCCLLLACGLALRGVPWIEARADGFRLLVRRTLPLMIVLVGAMTGLRFYQLAPAEERELAHLPAARPGAPNVLFVVLDTVRADRLSLYGYHRDTSPNLVNLARRGVTFEHARAAAPWTLPSHASMFTGRWPHDLRVYVNRPLDSTYPTLAECLRDQGYATAGFVANTRFCSAWYGLNRGFIHYEDYYDDSLVVSFREVLRSAELGRRVLLFGGASPNVRYGHTHHRKDAAKINDDFLTWLSEQGNRPFFAFLNYYDAHDPYVVPAGFDRHFGLVPTTPADFALVNSPHVNQELASGKGITSREISLVRDSYDDCLAYLDEQLGRLFEELDGRGVLSNTLVVVTSDHGEHLGEHQIYGHGQSLYRPEIHVPLIIHDPTRAPAGRVVSEPVSLRDVAATIVERLGLRDRSPLPGQSLARFWDPALESMSSATEPILSECIRPVKSQKKIAWPPALRGPMHSFVADGKIYIRNGDGIEELYDLEGDPGELHNLSNTPANLAAIEQFRAVTRREGIDELRP